MEENRGGMHKHFLPGGQLWHNGGEGKTESKVWAEWEQDHTTDKQAGNTTQGWFPLSLSLAL